jgi:hypothetical protein
MSRLRRRSLTTAIPVMGAAALLIGALTWPLLFTGSGFSGDWTHQLWLLWHQSLSIRSSHFPSLFINSSYSVFDPIFAFYGGTLYAVTGLLSLAMGGAPVQAYVCVYMLDFLAALAGWYWLGRMAGVGRWLSLVPGLIFVTSAYYLMVLYVRGDWPEFTGVSMIPLMVAASLSVMRGDRLRVRPAVALAVSSMLFFGAHNITILLGLTMLALTGLAVLICVPDARRQITRRGILRVACVIVPAALVSAWYLLPVLAYHSRTLIGSNYVAKQEVLTYNAGLVSFDHLFTLSRVSATGPSPYPFALSLPVLAIAWVLIGILVLSRGGNRAWARLLLICSLLTVLVTVVMTHVSLLLALPRVYWTIQFTYRLESYVLLELSAAILAALALSRGTSWRGRAWRWMALPVCVVSLIGAIQQILVYPYPGPDRYDTLKSYAEFITSGKEAYQDVSAPVIIGRLPTLNFPLSAIHDNRASVLVRVRPGTLAATNIAAGTYLLNITGAEPVGVDPSTDRMVLRIGSAGAAAATGGGDARGSTGTIPPQRISVSTGDDLPIVLGRLLTLGALAVLSLELLVVPVARLARWIRIHRGSQDASGGEAGAKLTEPNL